MNRFFNFLMLVAMSAAIFSCGEDEKDAAPVSPLEERTLLLTGGSSKAWAFTAQYDSEGYVESECMYDNVVTYNSGGDVSVVVNQICYEGEEDSDMKWKFNDDATILQWVDGYVVYDFEVVDLTATKLVISMEMDLREDTGDDDAIFVTELHYEAK